MGEGFQLVLLSCNEKFSILAKGEHQLILTHHIALIDAPYIMLNDDFYSSLNCQLIFLSMNISSGPAIKVSEVLDLLSLLMQLYSSLATMFFIEEST